MTFIQEITPDFLRHYFLAFGEKHNPDGVQRGDLIGEQDRALFLFLLDTGARAREACNMNIKDVDLNTGVVIIRYGKGGKTTMVFIGRTTRRAIRAYLRLRHDLSPALFISKEEERLTYDGLRLLGRKP